MVDKLCCVCVYLDVIGFDSNEVVLLLVYENVKWWGRIRMRE